MKLGMVVLFSTAELSRHPDPSRNHENCDAFRREIAQTARLSSRSQNIIINRL
jgi:hypothetical protein